MNTYLGHICPGEPNPLTFIASSQVLHQELLLGMHAREEHAFGEDGHAILLPRHPKHHGVHAHDCHKRTVDPDELGEDTEQQRVADCPAADEETCQ